MFATNEYFFRCKNSNADATQSVPKKKTHTIFPITTTAPVCQQRHAIAPPHTAHTLWLYCSACYQTYAGVSCSIIPFLLVCAMCWHSFSRFVSLFIGFFFWLLSCSSLCYMRIRGTFGVRSGNKEWAEALKEVTSRIMAALTAIHIAFGQWGT